MEAPALNHDSDLESLETETLINEFEAGLAALGDEVKVDLPLKHTFTPGLYLRQIFMPAGSIVVSRRHLTEHPFIVLEGVADVFDEKGGYVQRIEAPFVGVTKAGTRRVLNILEDSTWLTAHVTDLTDPDEIVATITEHNNKLMPSGFVDQAFENTKELPL